MNVCQKNIFVRKYEAFNRLLQVIFVWVCTVTVCFWDNSLLETKNSRSEQSLWWLIKSHLASISSRLD